MARRSALSLLTLVAMAAPSLGQPAPFDMSPEGNLVVPNTAPQPGAPDIPAPAEPALSLFQRHLLPGGGVQLSGEESRQASYFYLTAAQAAAPAKFELAYLNALVVAPEFSSLSVLVNGTQVMTSPIMASSARGLLAADIAPGLLHAGANIVELRVRQRHRTDCSVASTYELWSQFSSADVSLLLEGDNLGALTQLSDFAALGVDANGNSTLRIVDPISGSPDAAGTLLQLAQQIAIGWRVAELRVEHAETPTAEFQEGVLDLVAAPAADLPERFARYRDQALQGPLVMLVPSETGANTLIVSGSDWASTRRAGDALSAANPAEGRPRMDLGAPHPLLDGGTETSLSTLGLPTTEFNGRRLTDRMSFDLPADFYADNYGELDLVLDAAYSSDVQPGSEIDVYVNGQIASATSLLRTDGGTLRDTVIRIPMTHLQPGRNLVDVAVNLQTQSDQVCSAGWTGEAPVRFILSNTSRLRLPDYARAVSVPDLQVFSGSGWPYAGGDTVAVALGGDENALISAMTLLARVAASSGKVASVSVSDMAQLDPAANALLIMPYTAMAQPIQVRTGFNLSGAGVAGDGNLLNRFGNEAPGPVEWLTNWLGDGIGLTPESLRILPAPDDAYIPPPGTIALSQSRQQEGGLWTVLTAPDAETLTTGTQRLTQTANWRQIGGRVTALGPDNAAPMVIGTNNVHLVQTQPLSFNNVRLVAANWFSGNILFYSALIAISALILMLATSAVLARVGRRS